MQLIPLLSPIWYQDLQGHERLTSQDPEIAACQLALAGQSVMVLRTPDHGPVFCSPGLPLGESVIWLAEHRRTRRWQHAPSLAELLIATDWQLQDLKPLKGSRWPVAW